MIKEIPFQYDLDNPVVELKFQSELSKIVKHYDSLTISEEAEVVKILLGKIYIPTVFNWIHVFNEMAAGCDVPILASTVDGFRFVLMTCFEDARRAKARTVFYRDGVISTSETHHGDIKTVSFKEKNQANPTKSGNKRPGITKAESFLCQFCDKNNHSNADCRTRTSEFTNNQNCRYIDSEAHGWLAAEDRDWIPKLQRAKRADDLSKSVIISVSKRSATTYLLKLLVLC